MGVIQRRSLQTMDRLRPRPPCRARKLPKPRRKPVPHKAPELTDAQLAANGAWTALAGRRDLRNRKRRLKMIVAEQRAKVNARASAQARARAPYGRSLMKKRPPEGASDLIKRVVRWEEPS